MMNKPINNSQIVTSGSYNELEVWMYYISANSGNNLVTSMDTNPPFLMQVSSMQEYDNVGS